MGRSRKGIIDQSVKKPKVAKKKNKGRFASVLQTQNRRKYGIANTCIRRTSCRNEKNDSTRINEYYFAG